MSRLKKIIIPICILLFIFVGFIILRPYIFCIKNGEEIPTGGFSFLQRLKCCSGLKAKTNAIKNSAESQEVFGNCAYPACECNICLPCGNGSCDKNENECNCPEDCKE